MGALPACSADAWPRTGSSAAHSCLPAPHTDSFPCTHCLRSAKPYQLELIGSMQPFFADNILPLLTPVDELWQPADFLPPSHEEEYLDQVRGVGDLLRLGSELSELELKCLNSCSGRPGPCGRAELCALICDCFLGLCSFAADQLVWQACWCGGSGQRAVSSRQV